MTEQNTESAAAPRKPKNQAKSKAKAVKKTARKPAAEKSSKPARTKKAAEPRVTKQAKAIEVLCRPEGATIAEIMEMTGWQEAVERITEDGRTSYRVPSVPAEN